MLSDGNSHFALNALNALNDPKALGKCIHFYKKSEALSALSAVERKGRVERKMVDVTPRESHRIAK